jgi:RHS repeat-associated protein
MTSFGSLLNAGYTGDGLRAWKQNGAGVRTYFLYDGTEPVVEMDSTGAVTATNTFGAEGLLSRHTAAGSTFYTFDAQGSVCQRLNSSQGVTSTVVYDAFGNLLSGSSSDPWGFGAAFGYYTDTETGLQLLTHRYYDPTQGRFLNRDPLGYQGGINVYCYAANSVPNGADPTGHDVYRVTCKPWGPWYYSHAFLRLTGRCNKACDVGFFSESGTLGFIGSVAAGAVVVGPIGGPIGIIAGGYLGGEIGVPGTVNFQDHQGDYKDSECRFDLETTSPAQEAQLCRCIKNSAANPPRYTFGNVCGSWNLRMLECMRDKTSLQ